MSFLLTRKIFARQKAFGAFTRAKSSFSMPFSSFSSVTSFKAEDLIIEETKAPKAKPSEDHVYEFGKLTTDHMLEIDWDVETGWGKPLISPYHNFSMDPF
mmetsp:Transcript_13666/g.15330  ORF Transcript_13666/g.15330 Transcript_13666/m.15330 type:complete len:100 (-) Transcript_13666:9-308(-)